MNFNTNFGATKNEYKKFRPTYPADLFKQIFHGMNKIQKVAVDLGAGTGISAKYLCENFEEVYYVEPDKKMVEVFSAPSNVKIFNCCGENFDTKPESVDLVTSGNAFYWMDGDLVVKKVHKWLKPEGVFAAYRYDFPITINKIQKIIDIELEERWNQYRDSRLIDTEYSLRTITNSNLFSDIKVKKIPNMINLNKEELIGFFRSTSYGSAYISSIKDKEKYIYNLLKSIEEVDNNNSIPVDFSMELIIATK